MHEYNTSEASGYPTYEMPKGDAPPENIRINPNRKEHYQLVAKIKDAPLKFQVVEGRELYQATNCYYVTDRWVGATANPQYSKMLDIIKVDDNTYVADFYTDTPLDEDYYGDGVCKWQFLSAGIGWKPTGKDKRETALIARIDSEDLKQLNAENPEIIIEHEYQKKNFPIATDLNFEKGWSDYGIFPDSGLVLSSQDKFSVELTIRKVQK
ncbi:hypothetical protein [Neisseria sp. CCUG12390]|uniref:hypothetical protein n=1 Tax=Neisseria sp. CCUG12390 TaxID=3392035 RepID=UPI003A101E26